MVKKVEERPPKVQPRIRSAPKIRSVYWCDFPKDAQLPEFWKTRPVLVVSKNSSLYGSVIVLPLSSNPQPNNPKAYEVVSPINNKRTWVICNYLTTVAVSRLSIPNGGITRLDQQDFNNIIGIALNELPRPDYS